MQSWTWRRLTNRNWPQFSIRWEDGDLFVLKQCPTFEALWPRNIEYADASRESWNHCHIVVEGVTVSIFIGVGCIEVIVKGELPNDLAFQVAEEIRANTEATIQRRCFLEPV